jgi:hypothetical protein
VLTFVRNLKHVFFFVKGGPVVSFIAQLFFLVKSQLRSPVVGCFSEVLWFRLVPKYDNQTPSKVTYD